MFLVVHLQMVPLHFCTHTHTASHMDLNQTSKSDIFSIPLVSKHPNFNFRLMLQEKNINEQEHFMKFHLTEQAQAIDFADMKRKSMHWTRSNLSINATTALHCGSLKNIKQMQMKT